MYFETFMFVNKQSDLHLILELQQAFEKSCSYLPISELHGIVAWTFFQHFR